MSLEKKLVNTLIYLSRRSQLEVLYIKAGGNNAESFKIDSGFEVFHILFKSCLFIYWLYILQLSLILFVYFW